MKYGENNKPLVCMLTQNSCYKNTIEMEIKGILLHSTGANNSYVKRYVQPSDDAKDKDEMLKILGKHKYKNDWNHIPNKVGVNAFIGRLADGSVATVQTMPWNYRPWGCGSGIKGSGNDNFIQVEICEDNLIDKDYFNAIYKEVCEWAAYLCLMYNIDPKGKFEYKGQEVPTIICHKDAYNLKIGSNHGDIIYWIKKHNKTMDDIREDIQAIIDEYQDSLKQPMEEVEEEVELNIGDLVSLTENAKYYNNVAVPASIKAKKWFIKSISGNRVIIDKSEDGKSHIYSAIHKKYLKLEKKGFQEYKVAITASALNVRGGPSTAYPVKKTLRKNDIEIIIEEKDNWGKLKSGYGWIGLKYTKKI